MPFKAWSDVGLRNDRYDVVKLLTEVNRVHNKLTILNPDLLISHVQ